MARIPESVLVTGATGALGSVVAERFSKAGCRVFRASHETAPTQFDFDAWIHCAGGFRFLKTDEAKTDDLGFLIDVNLRSALTLAREVLPGMKKRNFGRIVFVSARASLNPTAGMGPYAATKAGLNALASAMADEVRSFDINVNAVLPTILDTPMNRKEMSQADFSAWVPIPDLAEIIFSLTQPWGKAIHGALIPVSGRL